MTPLIHVLEQMPTPQAGGRTHRACLAKGKDCDAEALQRRLHQLRNVADLGNVSLQRSGRACGSSCAPAVEQTMG